MTYTLTVTNNGPNAGTNVVSTDTLPAGATYVSSDPPTGHHLLGDGAGGDLPQPEPGP